MRNRTDNAAVRGFIALHDPVLRRAAPPPKWRVDHWMRAGSIPLSAWPAVLKATGVPIANLMDMHGYPHGVSRVLTEIAVELGPEAIGRIARTCRVSERTLGRWRNDNKCPMWALPLFLAACHQVGRPVDIEYIYHAPMPKDLHLYVQVEPDRSVQPRGNRRDRRRR